MVEEIGWQWCPFEVLTPAELYELMGLRQRVFVLEQRCAYLDADGLDPAAWHLLGWEGRGEGRRLVASARVFAGRGSRAAISRVATDRRVRGRGVGRELMAEALSRCEALAPGEPIGIQAQAHLERFYEGFGFRRASGPYLFDGIVHLDMVRPTAGGPIGPGE